MEHLHGVRDEASTRALIAQENRRYARRQLIWFRKEPNLSWFDGPGESAADDRRRAASDRRTAAGARTLMPAPESKSSPAQHPGRLPQLRAAREAHRHDPDDGRQRARGAHLSIKHRDGECHLLGWKWANSEIVMRLLSAEAKIKLADMRSGRMTDDDWTRLARRISEISEAPLYIDDSPNLTIVEIRAKARRLSRKGRAEADHHGLHAADVVRARSTSRGSKRCPTSREASS